MFPQKYIHLDLKGAPPKAGYLKSVFPLFRQWGATGLCIEWEDMLPFEGRFEVVRSPYAYSRKDVAAILAAARDAGLDVMPLVQTFGHLEFVLKHDAFAALREQPDDPMNVCPSHPEALATIRELVDQVLDLHPGVRAIHLGADEVWTLGSCAACAPVARDAGKAALFLRHVKPLLEHARGRGVESLIWDDMLREWPAEKLGDLAGLAAPVVWRYGPDIEQRLPEGVWARFAALPGLWAASAFKGAGGIEIVWPDFGNRAGNHAAWAEKAGSVPFRGIILTGWSRYSHFASLCEILPVGLPALALSLKILETGAFTDDVRRRVFESLGLGDMPFMHARTEDIAGMPTGNFPGAEVFRLAGKLQGARALMDRAGWDAQAYFPRNNGGRLDAGRIRRAIRNAQWAAKIAEEVKTEIRAPLAGILFRADVKEFLDTKVNRIVKNARSFCRMAEPLVAG